MTGLALLLLAPLGHAVVVRATVRAAAVAPAPVAPPGPAALPAVMPLTPAVLTAPADAPRVPEKFTRDIKRDEAAALLDAAGLPALLASHGLVAWHILRHQTRSGERVWITLGLPREGRPFRGPEDEERQAELSRKRASVEADAALLVARVLGVSVEDVAFNERLVEDCCGAGCQSCLLTKEELARPWTGEKPRSIRP